MLTMPADVSKKQTRHRRILCHLPNGLTNVPPVEEREKQADLLP